MPGIFFLASDLGPSGRPPRRWRSRSAALADRYRRGRRRTRAGGRAVRRRRWSRPGSRRCRCRSAAPLDVGGLRQLRQAVRRSARTSSTPSARRRSGSRRCWLAGAATGSLADHRVRGRRSRRRAARLAGPARFSGRPIGSSPRPGPRPTGTTELGVPADRIAVIPPGVPPAPPTPDPAAFRKALDIPDACPAGDRRRAASTRPPGCESAVWAFDMLRYTAPDLYLVLVGDGPERDRAGAVRPGVAFDDYRVRFAGRAVGRAGPARAGRGGVGDARPRRGRTSPWRRWPPAGRSSPSSTPDLAEVIEDGVTGRLVPPERPDQARGGDERAAGRPGAGGAGSGRPGGHGPPSDIRRRRDGRPVRPPLRADGRRVALLRVPGSPASRPSPGPRRTRCCGTS